MHENAVVKVRDDVPFEQLELIGCGVTTGVGAALNTAQVEPGSTVAVIDQVETQLGMARQLGATDVIDASGGGVVEKVLEMTGGGVQYSIEAIGTKETAEQAYEMLRPGGTATLVGMIPEGVKIELDGASFLNERRIQGSDMGSNRFRTDMPRYIEFYLQGRLKLDEMVTQRLKLGQINDALEDMKQGHVARSVVTFA